jgi:hypothetical protein
MGMRSKVAMLPEAIRTELERRIVERGFRGYQELADWLQERGYQIAEDSVQRYGFRLRHELEAKKRAAQLANAIAAAAPEGDDAIVEATINIINQRVFSLVLEAEQLEPEDLPRLVRIAAQLSRISIARQRRAEQIRAQLEQDMQAVAKAAKPGGLSPETARAIRNALLGIHPFEPTTNTESDDEAHAQAVIVADRLGTSSKDTDEDNGDTDD